MSGKPARALHYRRLIPLAVSSAPRLAALPDESIVGGEVAQWARVIKETAIVSEN